MAATLFLFVSDVYFTVCQMIQKLRRSIFSLHLAEMYYIYVLSFWSNGKINLVMCDVRNSILKGKTFLIHTKGRKAQKRVNIQCFLPFLVTVYTSRMHSGLWGKFFSSNGKHTLFQRSATLGTRQKKTLAIIPVCVHRSGYSAALQWDKWFPGCRAFDLEDLFKLLFLQPAWGICKKLQNWKKIN